MKFHIKKYKSEKMIQKSWTSKKRKILSILHRLNFENGNSMAYLRVEYGRYPNNRGKEVTFYNSGCYFNQQDLMLAFEAFKEVEI